MTQSDWTNMLGIAIMLLVPAYLVLQIGFGIIWRGRWRLAALVPLVAFVPIVGYSLLALSQGSNLWPLLAIVFAPFGFLYLVILAVLQFVSRRKTAT